MRLVSLTPTTTEYVFALGKGADLVGKSAACDWPPPAREIRSTGPVFKPDPDLIDRLAPDLILAHAGGMIGPLAELEARGHRLALIDPPDIAGVVDALDLLGGLLWAEPAAEETKALIKGQLEQVDLALAGLKEADRPLTVRLMEARPIIIAGPASFMADVIHRAGGRGPTGLFSGPYPQLEPEELAAIDPEIIYLCDWPEEELSRLADLPGWGRTRAVKNGQIALLTCGLACRPGPRIGRYVIDLARALHPEITGLVAG